MLCGSVPPHEKAEVCFLAALGDLEHLIHGEFAGSSDTGHYGIGGGVSPEARGGLTVS